MSRGIITILFFATAITVFFAWTNPAFKEITELKVEKESFTRALESFRELQEMRDRILEKFNSISVEDSASLAKMVPEDSEQTELMVEISNLAQASGVVISRLDVQPEAIIEKIASFTPSSNGNLNYRKVDLDISFSSSYEGFSVFLKELQKSLRLVDINEVGFTGRGENLYEFNIKAVSYFKK